MVLCVLVGAGFEHARMWLFAPELAVPADVGDDHPRVVTVKDESSLFEAESLRKRVAELEKMLDARDVARVQAPKPVKEETQPVRPERSRRQSWAARMEKLKNEDPERYAEMQKHREEFRQQMEQREMDRENFLAALDVKNMSAAQRENHEKLLATLARVNELMAQMKNSGTESSDATRQEMGAMMGQLHDLYDQERTYLLEETAKAAGYSGSDVASFTDQIQTIIESTSMHGGHGGGPGGPGGGPPGGP